MKQHPMTGRLAGVVMALALVLPPALAGEDLTRAAPLSGRQARELGVGRLVPDLPVELADGTQSRLSALLGDRATVLVLRSVDCPISRKYAPILAELEAAHAPKGVRFLYVNPMSVDSAEAMREEAAKHGLAGPYVRDAEQGLAKALGARTTTEVIVLDADRTVRYRGAVDDQIGLGFVLPEPKQRYLTDALAAVLGGDAVPTAATIAPGCALATAGAVAMPEALTYHNAIGRIMAANCVSCHRSGGVGPFRLDEYPEVAGRTPMIEYMVGQGHMPPWDAAPGTGPWKNDFSLTDAEREAVLAWIAAGTPEGEPADGAPAPQFSAAVWTIGEPDEVYEVPTPVEVPASGTIDYVYQWVQTTGQRDRWVQAVEVIGESSGVLHHALVFVEEPRKEGEDDRRYFRRWNGGAEGYFAGYVPGQGPTVFPEGFGMRLPRRAWLKFQLHYTPNGEAVTDRVRIGFKFAETTPENKVEISGIANNDFVIPPGASDVVVTAESRIARDAVLAGFSPHMHFRGRSFTYELVTPEGERTTLLEVPDYDYNWQTMYEFATPLEVAKGSKIVCTAVFDNSEANPRNPDPGKEVRFGEQTWDEMMIGYYMWWPQRKEIGGSPIGSIAP